MNIALVLRNSDTGGDPDFIAMRNRLEQNGVNTEIITEPIAKGSFDFVLSVGGDGTMLSAVSLVRDSGVPIVGVNFGHLGFLTTMDAEATVTLADDLREGRYAVEHRTLLQFSALDAKLPESCALNEVSLHRQIDAPMLRTRVFVDDRYVATYSADGLIVATPTGSTAYSMSCGGPILTPDSGCFAITPICAHSLTLRPIIVPDTAAITLITEPSGGSSFCLSADSRHTMLPTGTTVSLHRAGFTVGIVRMRGQDFFSAIHEKLSWDA